VLKEKGRPDKEFSYKIDASKTPRQIETTNGDNTVTRGIYELKGDTLKIGCPKASQGKGVTSFDAKDIAILYLKRAKP
jgi:uncharacterized protein (TIGR03067 family)